MTNRGFEEEEFPEPEDSDSESPKKSGNEEEEEEEEGEELVVIDDDFLQNLLDDIEKSNPIALARGVDVILGALKLRDNIIFDEENTINPLSSILVPLTEKVFNIYEENFGKNASKRKTTEKMLTDIVQVYDSFDSFKSSKELIQAFCRCIFITRSFVDKSDVSKSLAKATKFALTKSSFAPVIIEAFRQFAGDPKFTSVIFKLRFVEFTNAVSKSHFDAVERMLDPLVDFYIEHGIKAKSYVKGLIQNLASQLSDGISKGDKAILSWHSVGLISFITSFTIKSKEEALVYPFISECFVFLRNYPIPKFLPFQIIVARAVSKISAQFHKIAPLLSWLVDAMTYVCSLHCKGSGRFNWESNLVADQHPTFEYAEESFEKLSSIVLDQLSLESENIAFPEYTHIIRRKLENIASGAKNDRLKMKPKGLIRKIIEQQDALIKIKKNLQWKTRGEQINAWGVAVSQTNTPLKYSIEKAKAVEAIVEQTKKSTEKKETIDQTGDRLELVNADNFMD